MRYPLDLQFSLNSNVPEKPLYSRYINDELVLII